MRNALLAMAFLLLFADSVRAATLGLTVEGDPEITASGTALNLPFVLDFAFTASGGNSTAPAPARSLEVALTAAFQIDGNSIGFGALNVGSASTGLFLSGDLVDSGFVIDAAGEDSIELLYSIVGGSASANFGPQALAVVRGEFGSSISDLFATGFSTQATVSINPITTPVPVPGSLPLLATAVIVFSSMRRRRSCT